MLYMLYLPRIKKQDTSGSVFYSSELSAGAWQFTADRMRRYQGAWHLETVNMLPECAFLESSPAEIGQLLKDWRARLQKSVPGCAQRDAGLSQGGADLGTSCMADSLQAIPVPEETACLLRELGGTEHHLPMSRGVIRNGVMQITEGPLAGHERRIRRIDRHKRLAWMPVSGLTLTAGLEITEKTV